LADAEIGDKVHGLHRGTREASMRARLAASIIACFTVFTASCATAEKDVGQNAGGAPFGGAGGAAGSTAGSAGVGANGGVGGGTGGVGASGGAAGGTGGVGASGGAGGGTGGVGGGTGGVGGTNCTPPVPGGACDTAPQCGCPAGQRCTVQNTQGISSCVPDGTTQQYQSCSTGTECVAGTECVGSACKPFCNTTADCPGTLRECVQVTYTPTGGTPTPIPGFMICSSGCALEAPQALCGPGLGCYATSDPPTATDCAAAGTGVGVDACCVTPPCNDPDPMDGTKCAPAHVCLTTGDCRKWCRVGFPGDCPSGTCTGFTTPYLVNGTQYGVCP
jgi:hypothetical protein